MLVDHGPGIDPEDLSRIFERFSRARVRNKITRVRTGLVDRLAARHHQGGTVSAKSTPGEGAQFIVTFPRTVPSEEAPTPA